MHNPTSPLGDRWFRTCVAASIPTSNPSSCTIVLEEGFTPPPTSSPGLKNLAEEFQDLTLYTGCIDAELDERNYIVPGLGDAGDRLYGTESEDFLA